MGILSSLLGGGLGEKITEVIGKRVTDVNLAANLAAEARTLIENHEHEQTIKIMDAEIQIAAAQSATNQIEAASTSLFKSGWRPSAGYVCVIGLAYQFLLQPLGAWLSGAHGWSIPPTIATDDLLMLLGGMLGLGTMRTTERLKGKA